MVKESLLKCYREQKEFYEDATELAVGTYGFTLFSQKDVCVLARAQAYIEFASSLPLGDKLRSELVERFMSLSQTDKYRAAMLRYEASTVTTNWI